MHRSGFRVGARLLQLYFIIGLLALAGVWFFFSQFLLIRLSRSWQGYVSTLSAQLESDTHLRSRIYAKFMSHATETSEGSSPELDIIFDEIIKKLDFPVIVTDATGRPTSWRNLPVDNPDSAQLAGLTYVLDSEHEPVPLVVAAGDSSRMLGEIHYGLSASAVTLRNVNANLVRSVRYLTVFSVLQVLLLIGFVIVGVWGVLVYKKREQEQIWTALAKETAHQMATPLSSFGAWLDVLRERSPDATKEMEQDLVRMKEVLDRFSRIGLPPELAPHQVGPAIERSVAFVRRRSPKTVTFTTEVVDDATVFVDDVLFAWMLENLLKNSVDAIGTKPGEIRVRCALSPDRRLLEIEVTDSGEGVKTDRLFEPGVTTKKYGWGVGLTLAKRIVESYHQGRLLLKESQPGRTVFSIYLPVNRRPEKEPQRNSSS
ncbi:MAG TPA: HAMP domain-containing sensor histidine kinase [bacterium]|nr:HAMP domain-containing sensor histidine kinase [bacterium]